MAIIVGIDDLNIPASVTSDAEVTAELTKMIAEVTNDVLRVTNIAEADLTDQEELDFEAAIALEVKARFYERETPHSQSAGGFGPGELFTSRSAGTLVNIHYHPFATLV